MLRYSTLRKACPVSHSHICICHDSPIGKAHELDVTLLAAAVLQEVCPVTRSDICMCHDSSIGRLTNSMSRCSLLQGCKRYVPLLALIYVCAMTSLLKKAHELDVTLLAAAVLQRVYPVTH